MVSIMDKWTSEDTFSEYFHSFEGQLEYWLVSLCKDAMDKNLHKFPDFWFGAANSIDLYLIHPSYSPFIEHYFLGKPKMSLDWNMYNVPEGQEDSVDENFLPKNFKK